MYLAGAQRAHLDNNYEILLQKRQEAKVAEPIKTQKTTVRLPEDTYWRLKAKIAERRLDLTQALEQAVVSWMDTPLPAVNPALEHKRILQFADISEYASVVDAAEKVIAACERLIELGKGSSETSTDSRGQGDPVATSVDHPTGPEAPKTSGPKPRKGTGTKRGG